MESKRKELVQLFAESGLGEKEKAKIINDLLKHWKFGA
jgi:hypothetical protein